MLRARMEPANGCRAGLCRHPQPHAGSSCIRLPSLHRTGLKRIPLPRSRREQWHRPHPARLTLRGQVEADVAVEVHGAMEAAVAELTQAEGAAAVQLLALCMVAYLRVHMSAGHGLPGGRRLWHTGRRDGQHHERRGPPFPSQTAAGTPLAGNVEAGAGAGKAA